MERVISRRNEYKGINVSAMSRQEAFCSLSPANYDMNIIKIEG